MHVHYLKHVPFEGLGNIESLLVERGCKLTRTSLFVDQSFPSIHDIDALIIMGGPMGVYDEDKFPWLALEKEFIDSVLKREIPVMGICLGAQLIANVLGARVRKNKAEEIGWFPVKRIQIDTHRKFQELPLEFDVLHWHGDTFEIPEGAVNFIESEGCENQAFLYKENVLGLQFHLEMLPSHVEAIYQECGKPEKQGDYIQSLQAMIGPADKFQQAGKILKNIIETFIF